MNFSQCKSLKVLNVLNFFLHYLKKNTIIWIFVHYKELLSKHKKTKSYKNNKSTPANSPHINIRVQKWTFKLDINNRIASVTVSCVLLYISPIPYNCIEFSITSTGQISTRTTIIHMGSMNHRHIVSKISDGKRI